MRLAGFVRIFLAEFRPVKLNRDCRKSVNDAKLCLRPGCEASHGSTVQSPFCSAPPWAATRTARALPRECTFRPEAAYLVGLGLTEGFRQGAGASKWVSSSTQSTIWRIGAGVRGKTAEL